MTRYYRDVGLTRAEVLRLLDPYARQPKPSGPVALSPAYLRAIERWEALPDNAAGTDKSWVDRCRDEFEAHFARARLLP